MAQRAGKSFYLRAVALTAAGMTTLAYSVGEFSVAPLSAAHSLAGRMLASAPAPEAVAEPATDHVDRDPVGETLAPSEFGRDLDPAPRGVVAAAGEASISAPVAAVIADLPLKAGDPFKKGDLLVAYDCRRLNAERSAAWARHGAARRGLDQQRELYAYGATGALDLDVARAEASSAAAQAKALDAQVADCAVTAPFDGRVAEVFANAHETAQPGAQILRVLEDGALEIEMIVPSIWLRWLEVGAGFTFEVDETGRAHAAEVVRIAAAVDPVSQTVGVTGRFSEATARVLAGMSGSARFDHFTRRAEAAGEVGE